MREGRGLIVACVLLALLGATSGCDPTQTTECQQAIRQSAEAASEEEAERWRVALDEANETIEHLNSEIEEAQQYAGASYDEMEFALVNMDTGEKVDEP